MSFVKNNLFTVTIIAALFLTIVFVFYGQALSGSSFLEAFGSNFLSTLVGILIGIPVVLGVNNLSDRRTEKERKKKILELLSDELFMNLQILEDWCQRLETKTPTGFLSMALKHECWDTLRAGGELEWIKDPFLLGDIADAYTFIRTTKQIELELYKFIRIGWDKTHPIFINDMESALEDSMRTAKEKVEAAIDKISG